MKKTGLRISLKFKLLFMFLVVLIISILIVGTVAYKTSSEGMTKSVYNQLSAVSQDICNQIDAINQKHFETLKFLSEQEYIKDENISLEEKTRQLSSVIASIGGNYENVAFYDINGKSFTADGRFIDMSDRDYFTEAIKGHNYISNPTLSPVVNRVLQQYSVPVKNKNGKIIGALVLLINGNAMYDTIKDIDLGGGMHPSVIDYKAGITIANANANTDENSQEGELDETEGLGKVLNNIFAGKENIEDFVDPNLHAHLIAAYKIVPNTTWTVFTVAPYDIYFGALHSMQVSLSIILIVMVIISTILIIVFVRVLINPLKKVKESITTIATGNADLTQRIPNASNDEVGDVVKGFNGFVEKLQGIVTNLRDSKISLVNVDEELQAST